MERGCAVDATSHEKARKVRFLLLPPSYGRLMGTAYLFSSNLNASEFKSPVGHHAYGAPVV